MRGELLSRRRFDRSFARLPAQWNDHHALREGDRRTAELFRSRLLLDEPRLETDQHRRALVTSGVT